MKKKKSRKKLVIGVGVLIVAVVAGVNIYGSMNAADSAIPQGSLCRARHKSPYDEINVMTS